MSGSSGVKSIIAIASFSNCLINNIWELLIKNKCMHKQATAIVNMNNCVPICATFFRAYGKRC